MITPLDSNDQNTQQSTLQRANILGQAFEKVHHTTLKLGDAVFESAVSASIMNDLLQTTEPLTAFTHTNIASHAELQNDASTASNMEPIQIPQPLMINGYKEQHKPNTIHLGFTTAIEIENIIVNKNNKKSSGSDGVPNIVLRKLTKNFYMKIAIIFNQIYNNAYWPKNWKNAIIIPLLKPNKPPSNCDSYRPISLLPCISKIYETFILNKIKRHCFDNEIVPDYQFGFKEKHSTLHALSILQHDITSALNDRTPTIACSLDCAKAVV